MRKLLNAGFARLWKSKVFWGGALLVSGIVVTAILANYRQQAQYNHVYNSDPFIPGCFVFIGCFMAVFTSLFLGTEYSDGAIRNKLIAGHGRTSLYLSSLLLTVSASLLVCAASILVALAVGISFLGMPVNPLLILQKTGLGCLLLLPFASLFTLFSMLIHNKSLLSITAVLSYFLLLFWAAYINIRLEAPEYIENSYSMTVDGEIVPEEPYPNPSYLRGAKREVYVFLRDFLPTSQSLLMGSEGDLPHPLQMGLYSLLLTPAITLPGILAFRKKDLK